MVRLFKALHRLHERVVILRGRLRARLLILRGAEVGARVVIGRHCTIDRPWCLRLGDGVQLEERVSVKIVADDARVVVGRHCFIGRGTQLDVLDSIHIGEHSVIAPHCFLVDHDHGISPHRRIDEQPCLAASISIGSDVWLGVGVVVLAGAKVGDGAVIGAHSVVKGVVEPFAVAIGAPARPARSRLLLRQDRGSST